MYTFKQCIYDVDISSGPTHENHRGHSHGHSRENARGDFFIPADITAVIFEGGLIACQSFVIGIIILIKVPCSGIAVFGY